MTAPSSRHCQLTLAHQHGRWSIRFRGKRADFLDRQSAINAAVMEAYEVSKNGTPTQVVCVDDRFNLDVIWTYGVDPDPPIHAAGAERRGALRKPRRPHRLAGETRGARSVRL